VEAVCDLKPSSRKDAAGERTGRVHSVFQIATNFASIQTKWFLI